MSVMDATREHNAKTQLCVKKVFKTGSVYKSQFFKHDIKVTSEAAEIIKKFNEIEKGKPIFLNEPKVWKSTVPAKEGKKTRCLVKRWRAYQDSWRIYPHGSSVVLSKWKEFGPTDLGQRGIENFFMHHKCGRWCSPKSPLHVGHAADGGRLKNLVSRHVRANCSCRLPMCLLVRSMP